MFLMSQTFQTHNETSHTQSCDVYNFLYSLKRRTIPPSCSKWYLTTESPDSDLRYQWPETLHRQSPTGPISYFSDSLDVCFCLSVHVFVSPFQFLEHSRSTHALQRFGSVEEVASVVSLLVSDKAAQTTGASLLIDGGRHAMTYFQPPVA